MNNNKKICPLKTVYCMEEKCAWWCDWEKSCALVSAAATLFDAEWAGRLYKKEGE